MKYLLQVTAAIFILLNSEYAPGSEDKIGKQCYVSYAHVVVNPNKSAVESWPDDPKVKNDLKGLDNIESHTGTVILETNYNPDPSDPSWRNKEFYIVKIGKYYFLVAEQGVTKCQAKPQ